MTKEGIKMTLNRLQRDIQIIDEYSRNEKYFNKNDEMNIARLIFDTENNIEALKSFFNRN